MKLALGVFGMFHAFHVVGWVVIDAIVVMLSSGTGGVNYPDAGTPGGMTW
jgi:hypothetical protein